MYKSGQLVCGLVAVPVAGVGHSDNGGQGSHKQHVDC